MRHRPRLDDGATNGIRTKPLYHSMLQRGPVDTTLNCCECGWPFKATVSVLFAGRDDKGEKKFKHSLCPSLAERRILRAEALNNA